MKLIDKNAPLRYQDLTLQEVENEELNRVDNVLYIIDNDVKVDDDLKLRLRHLTVNQLTSIGVAQPVTGKSDEIICPYCSNGSGDSRSYKKFRLFKVPLL